jgi:hypothetical protein
VPPRGLCSETQTGLQLEMGLAQRLLAPGSQTADWPLATNMRAGKVLLWS